MKPGIRMNQPIRRMCDDCPSNRQSDPRFRRCNHEREIPTAFDSRNRTEERSRRDDLGGRLPSRVGLHLEAIIRKGAGRSSRARGVGRLRLAA
jgi:hypothetical protein